MRTSFAQGAQDLLSGLGAGSGRRGQTVLKLIFARVSEAKKERSGRAASLYQSETLQDSRNLAYLGAVTAGAKDADQSACSIHDLERYAQEWVDIVPRSAAIRADLVRRLAEKYSFEARHIPGIRAALGMDEVDTTDAFRDQTGHELKSVYAKASPFSLKLRWAFTRAAISMENLPAFWASFALTITSTLGPSVLALPILFMSFGPLAAALMILGIGGINTLTLAYLAECQLRGGPVLNRSGFNQIIEHYLGTLAVNFLKISLFIYCLVVLFVYTGGFLDAIASTMGAGVEIWFIALFLFVLWYLSPGSNAGSLVSAFVISLINLSIIAGFTALVLVMVMVAPEEPVTDRLVLVPDIPDISVQIAIGAALYSFAGHISVSNSAQLVLRRKNSAKGFLRGAVIGMGAITVIYAVWTFATIAALTSGVLPQSGSILQSISLVFGPWAAAICLVFIVLSLGVGSGNYALAAHHVLVDTLRRMKERHGAGHVRAIIEDRGRSAWQFEHLAGLSIVAAIMGAAFFAHSIGIVDLNQFFSLIGGAVAPIISGVFPVLIFLACRGRGVSSDSRVAQFLTRKPVLFLIFGGFASIYVWQSLTSEYALWYRWLSVGLLFFVAILVLRLIRGGAFRTGGVVLIEKGSDGWCPTSWRVYDGGQEVTEPRLFWKTAQNGQFQPVSDATSSARVLSAVRLDTRDMRARRFDVKVTDKTSGKPVDFRVDQSSSEFLEIVLQRS